MLIYITGFTRVRTGVSRVNDQVFPNLPFLLHTFLAALIKNDWEIVVKLDNSMILQPFMFMSTFK